MFPLILLIWIDTPTALPRSTRYATYRAPAKAGWRLDATITASKRSTAHGPADVQAISSCYSPTSRCQRRCFRVLLAHSCLGHVTARGSQSLARIQVRETSSGAPPLAHWAQFPKEHW